MKSTAWCSRNSRTGDVDSFQAVARMMASKLLVLLTCAYSMLAATSIAQDDALPSWNEGVTKAAILDFVARVTTEGSEDFVPVAQRIATFDNDGTLWSEQPIYVQLAFALDRVETLAPEHPEWSRQEPFKAI